VPVPRNLESKYPYTNIGEFPAGTQAAWLDQLPITAYLTTLIGFGTQQTLLMSPAFWIAMSST